MPGPLGPWDNRDNYRRDPHQAVVDSVNELASLTPSGAQEVHRTPAGSGVRNTTFVAPPAQWVAIRGQFQGPGKYKGRVWEGGTGDINKTDALIPINYSTTGEFDSDSDGPEEIMIVNAYESWGADTHYLEWTGTTPTRLFPALYIRTNDDGQPVYMISEPPPPDLFGKVVNAWTPGGNALTMTRCNFNGTALQDYAGADLPDISVYISYPIGNSPAWCDVSVGDVIGLDMVWNGAVPVYVLKQIPQPKLTSPDDVLTIDSTGGNHAKFKPIPPASAVSDSFTSADTPAKSVTVANGVITNIT